VLNLCPVYVLEKSPERLRKPVTTERKLEAVGQTAARKRQVDVGRHFDFSGSTVKTILNRKSTVFLDVTPCSPVEIHRSYGRMYYLHLQDRRVSKARNQQPKLHPR
jgi:hypothetical protein